MPPSAAATTTSHAGRSSTTRSCAATNRTHAARLGDLSLKLNEPAVAATYFLRAAADSADAGSFLARAADAQLRAGDKDAARATAVKALERDPKNPLALTVQRRVGRPVKATDLKNEATKASKGHEEG